jgi:hypothetical protein
MFLCLTSEVTTGPEGSKPHTTKGDMELTVQLGPLKQYYGGLGT